MTPPTQLTNQLNYLTDSQLRIRGELKQAPEDFVVEEIPLYEPSGDGEHLYLWIEKRDISAEYLLNHISRSLQVHRNDIGVAGLKDRRAVTRQWISLPAEAEGVLSEFETENIRLLKQSFHTNKLKTGHLRGNRFEITLRTEQVNCFQIASAIAEKLNQIGIPNYFGDQRFGIDGETLQTGLNLLGGTLTPESIPRKRRKFLMRLSLSAVQSWLFNQVLSTRITDETVATVLPGDVLQVTASGGPFVSEETEVDQRRYDRGEVVTSGPLFGPKMKLPTREQGQFELSFLESLDLNLDHFSQFKKLTAGTRRPLLLRDVELQIEELPVGLKFQFSLPKGAYATVVLREFLKQDEEMNGKNL